MSYISKCFENERGVFVAASDYLKALPGSIAKWIPGRFIALGTDGYGRSDTREALREYFEVDACFIALAALHGLVADGKTEPEIAAKAIKDLDINADKINPVQI